jgi:hypothetical protein
MSFEDRRNRSSYPFIGGSSVIFSLPPGGKVLQGRLIVTGTLNVTGGTTNGTAIGEGGPINLIKRITITATRAAGSRYPGSKLVDCHPGSLLRYAINQHSGKFIGELSGSAIGNGAAGAYPIYLSIPIYWADPTLRNQVQTSLNLDPQDSAGNPIYSNVQVQVDTASSLALCFSGNDRTCDFSGLSIQWDDDRLVLTGDTTPIVQEDHEMSIDFAMPQDGAFTSMLILAELGASRALSDALLNRVTITAPTLNFDEYALDIRQKMYDDEWYDPSQPGIGQYFIDFTNGAIQNSNPARAVAALFDVNNVSGANLDQLHFYTRRLFALS